MDDVRWKKEDVVAQTMRTPLLLEEPIAGEF